MASITGIGAVTALGRGTARVWSAMAEGWDGIAAIRRFDPTSVGVALAGMVPDRNAPEHAGSAAQLCTAFAIDAAREAWSHAALDGVSRDRIALVFGSSLGDETVRIHEIAERVGDALGIAGPRLAVSTACASSANAIGMAIDLLALGVCDIVIAGGADVVTPLVLAGFTSLGVLASGKCAPFSEPAGTTLGEGAAFVVLERDTRRAPARFAILGYGLSADGFHDTGPDPSGAGIVRGVRSALDHAGVSADDIDYVNAHGTGTRANDPAEWRAIQHVFGPRAATLPVSASKSFLAHGQGAAGVLELVATVIAMEHGTIPPTQRYAGARPNSPGDAVGQATARAARCTTAVCASSGFGGANCSLVVGETRPPRVRTARPIWIAGAAIAGADVAFERVVPTADPRGLDPATRYLTAACALALGDAGLRLIGDARDRAGLVAGVSATSAESDRALRETIAQRGHRGLSASLFARQVLNAPAGTCARLLGLRGLHSTITAGPATGLFAIAYAAELLATRRSQDLVLAVGVDELAPGEPGESGAACVALTSTPSALRLAGWGLAGPGELAAAAAAALAMAGLGRGDRVVEAAPGGFAPAAAVAQAVRELAGGSVLVVQRGGHSAACAIVLTGDRHAT